MLRKLLLMLSLALPLTAMAGEGSDALRGVWESRLGTRYVSDGTDFRCTFIPTHLMGRYGHWLHKNRLEAISSDEGVVTAVQILRMPDGKTGRLPAQLMISDTELILMVTEKNMQRAFHFIRIRAI